MNNLKDVPKSLEELPRPGRLKDINGKWRTFKILDECWVRQSDYHEKIITLQKFRWDDTAKVELRLGYWIKAKRGKRRGKWTWGQRTLQIPPKDFSSLVECGLAKGFFKLGRFSGKA